MFVFPSSQGKLLVSDNPAGKISIGDTITISYALKIARSGKVRFIGVDGSSLSPSAVANLRIVLKVESSQKYFGFFVRDTRQPNLDISINPSFMAKVKTKNGLREKIAQQGNLNVVLAPVKGGYKIISVVLD